MNSAHKGVTVAATDNFYITTPIYYVNSKPHMGHAYTTILCDAIKRYYQFSGRDTFFLTGTDEHGDKIQKSAEANKIDVQKMVDQNSEHFKNLLPIIESTNDDFIRTTDERHKKVVQELLQKVYDKGDIYFAEYEGKYCYGCERFLGNDELIEGKCPDHKTEPDAIKEANYFFKMSKYWDDLKKHIDDNPDFIVPDNFKKEVLGLLRQDPQDLCISRPKSRLQWGIELPFDQNFVTYVWFDALINYVSGLDYPDSEKYKKFWPNAHHVIAKDILKPHCVYWPTMLLSIGIPLPKQVAIHGYWLIDESKMSKSVGKTVDPIEYSEKYGADLFRYFLLRNMRFGRDASFTQEEFISTINAELANNLGNLYSRLAGMCRKNNERKIPAASEVGEMENALKDKALSLKNKMEEAIQNWKPDQYIEGVIDLANHINKYLDETKPWALAKEEGQKEE